MNKARDEGVEAVRAWADGRIGRERGWLETLIADFLQSLMAKQHDNKELEQAQTDETVAALGGTLQVINDLKLGGMERLDRDGKELLGSMTKEEQELLKAYFSEGTAKGDTVLLLASLLAIRLRRQRQAAGAEVHPRQGPRPRQRHVLAWTSTLIGQSQKRDLQRDEHLRPALEGLRAHLGHRRGQGHRGRQGRADGRAGQGGARRPTRRRTNEDLDERMDSELSRHRATSGSSSASKASRPRPTRPPSTRRWATSSAPTRR